MSIDLDKIKTVHFIGIKGVGMSALAIIMKQMGYTVAGSDVAEKFITDKNLQAEGIPYVVFSEKNLDYHPDLVVLTPAWGRDNVEVNRVRRESLTQVSGAQLLGLLLDQKKGIVVTGTHGKTTTAATLSFILKNMGLDPSYFIGTGKIFGLEGNGHYGQGDYFVCEGDEYRSSETDNRSKFMLLRPQAAILTSIEMDHPDVFSSLDDVKSSFADFMSNIRSGGFLAAWGDSDDVRDATKEAKQAKVEYYGFDSKNDWVAKDLVWHKESTDFTVFYKNKNLGKFTTQLSGKHSVLNAMGIISVCHFFGLDLEKVKESLNKFIGSERRLEFKGEKKGIMVFDDYAHHPSAIKTTLEGLRKRFPKKEIWCIFQPHTFSRTKLLLEDFASSFHDADHALIPEVWGSAREVEGDVSSLDIVEVGKGKHPDMRNFSDLDSVEKVLLKEVGEDSIVVTMGAGDVYHLADNFVKKI